MNKIVLSLAGVMAAMAFAPEASAVPVFARQTGMACSACHFQHFPALNGFGRAFKQAGYTMMGAQGKVEGEHISIPDRLNMAVLATAGIDKASGQGSNIFVPGAGGELQLFFGGKVTDFAGFLSEFGTAAPAGAASAKLSIMPEVTPGVRAGVTLFSAGQGAAGSYEMLNTGATSIHRLMGKTGSTVAGGLALGQPAGTEHIRATSARQYIAPEVGGTGVSFNVATERVVGSFAKANDVGPGAIGGTQGLGLPFKYLRVVGLFDVAGWDTGVGIQSFSGTGQSAAGAVAVPAAPAVVSYKATIIDGQMQGEMSGMPVGLYASYGTAPGTSVGGISNAWNPLNGAAASSKTSSFNIAGELGVMPGVATVQLALRQAKNGAAEKDNALMLGATYELAQNMELGLHYTTQSGSAWNTGGSMNPAGLAVGKNLTTFLLETLF